MGILGKGSYYTLFGLLFFSFWLLFKVGGMPDLPMALLSTTIDVLVTMGALLITVEVLLPKLHYRKRTGIFLACVAMVILSFGTLIILSQLRLLGRSLSGYQKDIARYQEHYFYWFWADLVFGSYFMIFFISAAGTAVRLSFDRIRAMNKLEHLQKEKALSELELLKYQINPHFLFNALNTIYYKIDRPNAPAREMLQQFSNMLRYQLYECNRAYVAVEMELSFIRSYIGLQQERLNDNYTVECIGFAEVKEFLISPFLLMPIVENCFKHVSGHQEEENVILIRCFKEGHVFRLYTSNTTVARDSNGENGIGLENVRRRLELMYPGKHSLKTVRSPGLYEATLQLEIE
jgi:two-component system, LytTR family, sensor kinase